MEDVQDIWHTWAEIKELHQKDMLLKANLMPRQRHDFHFNTGGMFF